MKQSTFTHPDPIDDKVTIFTTLYVFMANAARGLGVWKQNVTQHNALTELSSRQLVDAGISMVSVIRRDQQTLLKAPPMLKSEQFESAHSDDENYHIEGTKITELVTANRDSLSENFNAEIDAWAKHALASNGFADYLR